MLLETESLEGTPATGVCAKPRGDLGAGASGPRPGRRPGRKPVHKRAVSSFTPKRARPPSRLAGPRAPPQQALSKRVTRIRSSNYRIPRSHPHSDPFLTHDGRRPRRRSGRGPGRARALDLHGPSVSGRPAPRGPRKLLNSTREVGGGGRRGRPAVLAQSVRPTPGLASSRPGGRGRRRHRQQPSAPARGPDVTHGARAGTPFSSSGSSQSEGTRGEDGGRLTPPPPWPPADAAPKSLSHSGEVPEGRARDSRLPTYFVPESCASR